MAAAAAAAAATEVIQCSTDDFEYVFRITEHRERRLTVSEPCVLVTALLADESSVCIPCYGCSGFSDYGEFVLYYKQQVFGILHSCYSSMDVRSLHQVGETFTTTYLPKVDDERPCPRHHMNILERRTVIEIIVLLPDEEGSYVNEDNEELRVLRESFEEVEPMMKPATRESVEALMVTGVSLREKMEDNKRFDLDSNNVDRECVICIDKIESGESLMMPCLHVFHEGCLVKWLSNSHWCPLCRYELPYEDHRDFWSPD